jgi:maleate cis-trans isomerase
MFEESVPKIKLGGLLPLPIIDNAAYEFYRLAPSGVMAVMIPIGLSEFSAKDVERVFSPLDSYLDQLMDRGVHLVAQHGVPLPILIGVAAHDRMIDHMAKRTNLPASSTVLAVARGARDLGIKKLVVVNKWTDAMNAELAAFFAREGVSVVGKTVEEMTPAQFVKLSTQDNMKLAYDLGRKAFADHPDCDAIYIGGGAWLVEPIACELEKQYGKPVICNQPAMIRDQLKILNAWSPILGHSRLLGIA